MSEKVQYCHVVSPKWDIITSLFRYIIRSKADWSRVKHICSGVRKKEHTFELLHRYYTDNNRVALGAVVRQRWRGSNVEDDVCLRIISGKRAQRPQVIKSMHRKKRVFIWRQLNRRIYLRSIVSIDRCGDPAKSATAGDLCGIRDPSSACCIRAQGFIHQSKSWIVVVGEWCICLYRQGQPTNSKYKSQTLTDVT